MLMQEPLPGANDSLDDRKPELAGLQDITLGDMLRNKREEMGLKLSEVSKSTHIPVKYLEALELNQFDRIPAPTYVKGFLKTYATYLKLNAEKLISLYMNLVPIAKLPINSNFLKVPVKVENPWVKFIKELDIKIIGIILISIIFFYIFIKLMTIWNERKIIDESLLMSSQGIQKVGLPEEADVLAKKNSQHLQNNKIEILMEALGSVWLSVYVDDKLVYEHTMKKGEQQVFKAKDFVRIKIGDASLVRIKYNSEWIESLGQPAKVITVKFDKNGRWVTE